jgi:hypothetical protein
MGQSIRVVSVLLPLALAGCVTDSPPHNALAVAPGQASLTITRSSSMLFTAASATVELNGTKIASLSSGESYTGPVAPGPVVVTVSAWQSPGKSSYSFTVQPGKPYRLEVSPRDESLAVTLIGGVVGAAIEGGGMFKVTPAAASR